MHEPALLAERDRNLSAAAVAAAPGFVESLRELARSGYALDSDAGGEGLLLRHKVGPDLVLFEDGTVALSVSPPKKKKGWRARGSTGPRRIHWQRTFGVAFVAAVSWSLSVMLGVSLFSS